MAEFFRVTRDPSIMGGKACIRDTHITVSAVVALLSSGHQREDVIRMLPALSREDLTEAVAYAARLIDDPESALQEVETVGEPATTTTVTAAAPLPKVGPAPLNTSVSPLPNRKVTPLGSPIEESAPQAAEPAAAVAVAEAPISAETPGLDTGDYLPHPFVPEPLSEPTGPQLDESIELYHPAYPDKPTVAVSPEGIYDRRWSTHIVAWPDIAGIERLSGQKNIKITLRNPGPYIASMPFLKRISTQFKLAFSLSPFYLDTSSLGIRTKDLYYMATRLWHAHRGSIKFRKKRRVRVGKSSRDTAWEKCLPR